MPPYFASICHQPTVRCDFCGYILKSLHEKRLHMNNCSNGFERVNHQVCRYFSQGYCWKGNACAFSHPSEPPKMSGYTPACRNGPWCRYLAGGICRFFHRRVGVQSPQSQQQPQPVRGQQASPRGFCEFMEECDRKNVCPFVHQDKDFPPLDKNKPPENQENVQEWQEY